jgi:hypothetical protein
MRCMLVQLTIRRYNYILLIHNMVVNSHLFKQSNEWSTLINPPSEPASLPLPLPLPRKVWKGMWVCWEDVGWFGSNVVPSQTHCWLMHAP